MRHAPAWVVVSAPAFGLAFGGSVADGALLLLLFSAAHTAESLLYARAIADVGHLSALLPHTALVCVGGDRADLRTVPVAQVRTGDVLLVRAGEMVRPRGPRDSVDRLCRLPACLDPRAVTAALVVGREDPPVEWCGAVVQETPLYPASPASCLGTIAGARRVRSDRHVDRGTCSANQLCARIGCATPLPVLFADFRRVGAVAGAFGRRHH